MNPDELSDNLLDRLGLTSSTKAAGASVRRPILVLDGPRCSGKSTTGERVTSLLNYMGWHTEYFKKTLIEEDEHQNMIKHLSHFNDKLNNGRDIIVVDRFVASEMVMAIALGRKLPEIVIPYCREIDRELEVREALCEILLPPMTIIETRMLSRPADHQWDMPKERINGLWKLAFTLMPNHGMESRGDQELLPFSLVHRLISPSRGPLRRH